MKIINKEGQTIEENIEDIIKDNSLKMVQSPSEIMMEIASAKAKTIVDEKLLLEEVKEAIQQGYIHINDKEYYLTKSLTNLQYPLDKVLKYGFKAELCSLRPAKRIETAGILTCILMEIVQNKMHGGQSIPAFDYYLAPYVRMTFKEELNKIGDFIGKDLIHLHNCKIDDYIIKPVEGLDGEEKYIQEAINDTVKKVYQAMEAFIANMNTIHSRIGNRVIFSSINYGTDTSAEGRCIIRQLLLVTERGVGNNETPIFPIQIWKKKRGINYLPEDRNYDLFKYACSVTAKRYFPNYINLDATFNQNEKWKVEDPERYKYECATMGDRTRVFEDRFGEKTCIGRGNLSVSTINLPKIAIESSYEAQQKTEVKFKLGKESSNQMTEEYKKVVKEIFIQKLEQYANITAKQLYERYQFQASAIKKQFPLLMSGLWLGSEALKQEDKIESVLQHGTLSIGFIGLAECLTVLTGKHHGESEEAQNLGIEIIEKLAKDTENFSNQYNLNYTLLAAPAERVAGKFTKRDEEQYGTIPGVTDREYYTNSNHVPVWYECSSEQKAKIEGPYHNLTNGGNIFYVELERGKESSAEKVEDIVDLMDKYNIGYGAVNFPKTKCANCGFETARMGVKYCPVCDSEEIELIQRITGYLVGTTSRWNSAKLAELKDRIVHKENSADDTKK